MIKYLPYAFLTLAILFMALATRDFIKQGSKLTPQRKAWLILTTVFMIVSLGLFISQV